jgi:hypothetical protein
MGVSLIIPFQRIDKEKPTVKNDISCVDNDSFALSLTEYDKNYNDQDQQYEFRRSLLAMEHKSSSL